MKTRVLAATAIRGNTYIFVPTSSNIQSVKDLRGKKVAIFKGTNMQLSANEILEKFGLKESDIRAINMDTATARAAIATGHIDAAFGWTHYLSLRDRGLARVLYATEPRFLREVLQELDLQNYWVEYGADGKPKTKT